MKEVFIVIEDLFGDKILRRAFTTRDKALEYIHGNDFIPGSVVSLERIEVC